MHPWNPHANDLFASLVALPADQRAAALDLHCKGDSDLRRAVEDLLAAHDAAGSFLERPAQPSSPSDTPTTAPSSGPPLLAAGPVVGALANPGDTSPGDATGGDAPAEARSLADLPGNYRLDGEIARGGMGAVLRGHDTSMGRDVAVKVLLEAHHGRTELVQRFVEEARIAGQLQHPGVVPVYELGDGQGSKPPYFTMKLVKGDTLSHLLKARPSPAHELPRFISIFEQVCHAVAYAHSRRVIHRDLKPLNVMVGAFGEVQVMDWGLAKLLASADRTAGEQETGTVIHLAPSDSNRTHAGSVLGTPAYMAPEQARGEMDRVDQRADVFGLGAVLCEILTGQPPFVGSGADVLRLAKKGDTSGALARLDVCGADADLVGLCKRCLADKPEGRPLDAAEVARVVTAYQTSVAEKLRKAETARAEAQVKAAEERKRRKLAVALAASVLLTVVLGSGGAVWVAQENARQARIQAEADLEMARRRQEVTELLGQADAAAAKGDAEGGSLARGYLQRALALLEAAPDVQLRSRAQTLLDDMEEQARDRTLLVRLDAARLKAAETDGYRGRFARERALPQYRNALTEYGWHVGIDDINTLAAQLTRKPQILREAVVVALDDWVRQALRVKEPNLVWLKSLLKATDPTSFASRIRLAAAKPPAEARVLLEKLAVEADPKVIPPATLNRLVTELETVQARKSAVAVLRRAVQHHPGDFWLNSNLGNALVGDEAIRYQSAALALRPMSPGVYVNLGIALKSQKKYAEAIECFGKAIKLDPKYTLAHCASGNAFADHKKLNEAVACYRKALNIDSRCAEAHNGLGIVLRNQNKFDEAIACFNKAIQIDPTSVAAYDNLATTLKKQNKLDESIALLRKAIDIDPTVAMVHNNLGGHLLGQKKYDEGINCLRKAISIDPTLALAHENLGVALRGLGKLDESIVSFKKAIEIDANVAKTHMELGVALREQQKIDEAIACFRKAITIDDKYAVAHHLLGMTLKRQGKLNEAIDSIKAAIAIDPGLIQAHGGLGNALLARGEFAEARKSFATVLNLVPPQHPLRAPASSGMELCDRLVNAEKRLPEILRGASPASAAECLNIVSVCDHREKYTAASRFFAMAFAMKPALAEDLKQQLRFNASKYALLAAAGQGTDAGELSPMQRHALRLQALTWLRTDLARYDELAKDPDPRLHTVLQQRLTAWQQDTNLAGVRAGQSLDKLPASERVAWKALWTAVEMLLNKVSAKR